MNEALYNNAILAHARAKRRAGRLANPGASASVDNPLCGDRVTIDLNLENGVVSDFAQRVRGCVLCEAAASIIGAHAVGVTPAVLHAAADAARTVIAEGTPPDRGWPELSCFVPVHAHKSRHTCVLLPFQALESALAEMARDER